MVFQEKKQTIALRIFSQSSKICTEGKNICGTNEPLFREKYRARGKLKTNRARIISNRSPNQNFNSMLFIDNSRVVIKGPKTFKTIKPINSCDPVFVVH